MCMLVVLTRCGLGSNPSRNRNIEVDDLCGGDESWVLKQLEFQNENNRTKRRIHILTCPAH